MSQTPPSLIGRWQMLRAELNGEQAPELVTSKTELEFTATTYAVRYAGEVMDEGTYEVGPEPNLHSLILYGVSGTNRGRTIPCIYQRVGQRLRIAYGLEGRVPSNFAPHSGSGGYIASYKEQ